MSFDQQISCKNEGIPEAKANRKEKTTKDPRNKKKHLLELEPPPEPDSQPKNSGPTNKTCQTMTTKTPKQQKTNI